MSYKGKGMKYIIEFEGDDKKIRKTESFNSLMSAQLAQIFIPIWCESRIVPECECDPSSPYGDDKAGV